MRLQVESTTASVTFSREVRSANALGRREMGTVIRSSRSRGAVLWFKPTATTDKGRYS